MSRTIRCIKHGKHACASSCDDWVLSPQSSQEEAQAVTGFADPTATALSLRLRVGHAHASGTCQWPHGLLACRGLSQEEAEAVTGLADPAAAGAWVLGRPGAATSWAVIKLGPGGALLCARGAAAPIHIDALKVCRARLHSVGKLLPPPLLESSSRLPLRPQRRRPHPHRRPQGV